MCYGTILHLQNVINNHNNAIIIAFHWKESKWDFVAWEFKIKNAERRGQVVTNILNDNSCHTAIKSCFSLYDSLGENRPAA